MFEYTLVLRYPKGRTFELFERSAQPLKVGDEFDAFGRRWKLDRQVQPRRRTLDPSVALTTFACDSIPKRHDVVG